MTRRTRSALRDHKSRQLTDVDEVLRVLEALDHVGLRVGITGGWGIDALLGRQTREHGDIDLGLDATDVDRAVAALSDLGYWAG